MFAKVFAQIFDSSIAEDYRVRLVFEDFLKLADKDGIVDMTRESISRRTNVPIEIVTLGIAALEEVDTTSRTPKLDGRRITRLDKHRDWGWQIVNFEKYREAATKEMLRMSEADRKRTYRERKGFPPKPPIPSTETEAEAEQSRVCPKVSGTCPGQGTLLKEVFEEWNKLKGLPQCLLVSDKRRHSLEIRLKEPFFSKNWRSALDKLSQSPFCRGESDGGWRASFDWFITPDAVIKIMEGKYDKNTRSSPGKPNPRNLGIVVGPTNYATAKTKYDREREAKEAAMAGQVAPSESNPSAA